MWEGQLLPEVLRLPEELARVGALLDDPAFFGPFAPFFHPVRVRGDLNRSPISPPQQARACCGRVTVAAQSRSAAETVRGMRKTARL